MVEFSERSEITKKMKLNDWLLGKKLSNNQTSVIVVVSLFLLFSN